MARLHLFEFGDQTWLPTVLRDAMTGYLTAISRVFRLHRHLAPVVARALRESGAGRIVDLCSGSGGPVLEIRNCLAPPPSVVLTDKYPNRRTFLAAARPGVTALAEPIDATAVPAYLGGLRTMINAFHHFSPDLARTILADAATARAPIVVMELSERTILNVVLSPLILPSAVVMMPMVRPLRWEYLVFCYLVPILPLMIFWDGLVSHLRTYSRAELAALVAPIEVDAYSWRIERQPVGSGLRLTTLIGNPTTTG